MGYLGHDAIPALAFDHYHDSTFMTDTNYGIAFQMTHLASSFNIQEGFAQRQSVGCEANDKRLSRPRDAGLAHCGCSALDQPISNKPAWGGAPRASVTAQLPTGGGLVPVQQFGYLRLILSSFHEGANLISFSLAEMFVGYGQL